MDSTSAWSTRWVISSARAWRAIIEYVISLSPSAAGGALEMLTRVHTSLALSLGGFAPAAPSLDHRHGVVLDGMAAGRPVALGGQLVEGAGGQLDDVLVALHEPEPRDGDCADAGPTAGASGRRRRLAATTPAMIARTDASTVRPLERDVPMSTDDNPRSSGSDHRSSRPPRSDALEVASRLAGVADDGARHDRRQARRRQIADRPEADDDGTDRPASLVAREVAELAVRRPGSRGATWARLSRWSRQSSRRSSAPAERRPGEVADQHRVVDVLEAGVLQAHGEQRREGSVVGRLVDVPSRAGPTRCRATRDARRSCSAARVRSAGPRHVASGARRRAPRTATSLSWRAGTSGPDVPLGTHCHGTPSGGVAGSARRPCSASVEWSRTWARTAATAPARSLGPSRLITRLIHVNRPSEAARSTPRCGLPMATTLCTATSRSVTPPRCGRRGDGRRGCHGRGRRRPA